MFSFCSEMNTIMNTILKCRMILYVVSHEPAKPGKSNTILLFGLQKNPEIYAYSGC